MSALFCWGNTGTEPHPRKSRSPSATVSSARQTASPSTHRIAQAVLDRVAKSLVWVEKAAHAGHPQNRAWLASGWLPAVLEMALKSSTNGRSKTGDQGGPSANLSHGRNKRMAPQGRTRTYNPPVNRTELARQFNYFAAPMTTFRNVHNERVTSGA